MRYILDLEHKPGHGIVMPLRDTERRMTVDVFDWYRIVKDDDTALIFADGMDEAGFDKLAEGMRTAVEFSFCTHASHGRYLVWDLGTLLGSYKTVALAVLHNGAIMAYRLEKYGHPIIWGPNSYRAHENGFALGPAWLLDNIRKELDQAMRSEPEGGVMG